MGYDFSGWASRNNLRCGDGRIIRPGAFAKDNGKTVPLVYQHDHNDPNNVIGMVKLENRPEGVYCYGKFNDTKNGKTCKELVHAGNLNRLSIYANHLNPDNRVTGEVNHGMIREVSLVLAGANPGAVITNPTLEHGEVVEEAFAEIENDIIQHDDGSYEDDAENAVITMPYNLTVDPEDKTIETIEHADIKTEEKPMAAEQQQSEATVQDVFDSLTDEQKNVVYFLIGKALEGQDGNDVAQQDDFGYNDDGYYDEGDYMKHNVFEDQDNYISADDFGGYELSQDDFAEITDNIKRHGGTLKSNLEDFAMAHADDYGIKDIETLFPDATDLTSSPEFIKRETDWVAKFMNGTKHSPFSRIRTRFADITADEARAKGYQKGHKKIEEVFTLLKRTTEPCTIYKKQKIDRDDVIDITSFDVVAYIKGEMRIMYDEELARAALVGDGRDASSDDKIPEDHIRPIATDDILFTIKKENVTMFIRQDLFTRLLLLKDSQGYRLYKSPSELASALMVDAIQTVPNDIMKDVWSISVDLKDYTFGADKGGQMSFFEDFDIDYNQQKYLYEGRQSGCLTIPKSAIVFKKKAATPSTSGTNTNPEG